MADAAPALPQVAPGQPVLLIKDRQTTVGDACLTYRGNPDGFLLVDLYILQLDPHFGYLHRIDESTARNEFRVGEQRFKLLAANHRSLRLLPL